MGFKKSDNLKERIEGKAKERAGKVTGDEKMETKGKIQYTKAEAKHDKNMIDINSKEKIKDIKDK